MNKWMDYQNGLITDEEYMKSEYNGYIGKVIKNNHSYFVLSENVGEMKEYYIRDFENGVRSGFISNKELDEHEVFNFIFNESEDFRSYVETY